MHTTDFTLKNKVALITGSSRGLGYIFAEGLAEAGCKVIVNGRNKDTTEKARQALSEKGYTAFAYPFDVTNSKEAEAAIKSIEQNAGPVDILVNNAGIQRRAALEDFDENAWDELIAINLKGAFVTAKYVAQGMIKRKSGKIINICSLQSDLGRNSIAPYAASKGGLKMFTRAMAVEWARYNIQVNAIGPGYFKTQMTQPLYQDEKFDNWLRNRTPAKRWGNPDELLGALLFLASPASSYVNGQIIYVDGGITAAI